MAEMFKSSSGTNSLAVGCVGSMCHDNAGYDLM